MLRVNNAPYITKNLRKGIMKRPQLENIHKKTLTEKSLKAYKRQKTYGSSNKSSNNIKIVEKLNNIFKNVVASLDNHRNPYAVENVENMGDPVEKAIKKFGFHPNILLIKNRTGKIVSQKNLFSWSNKRRSTKRS